MNAHPVSFPVDHPAFDITAVSFTRTDRLHIVFYELYIPVINNSFPFFKRDSLLSGKRQCKSAADLICKIHAVILQITGIKISIDAFIQKTDDLHIYIQIFPYIHMYQISFIDTMYFII